MNISASDKWLAIDYRWPGKRYNELSPSVLQALGPALATSAPFDTDYLAPGHSWQLPVGAEHVATRTLNSRPHSPQ